MSTSGSGSPSRVEALLSALEALPPYSGLSLRGCADTATFVRGGQAAVIQGLLATTRRLAVATEQGTVSSLYAILGRSGRRIAAFSSCREEDEVVFLPGTVFHLAESRRLAGRTVRLVVEVDLDDRGRPLDHMLPRMAAEVEQLLQQQGGDLRAPCPPIPGKFAGDIN